MKFLSFDTDELEALQYALAYTGKTGMKRRDRIINDMLCEIKVSRREKNSKNTPS